jgi:hypothetical protein
MMKNKSAQIAFHVIGCTIFLLLPIIFWPGEGGIGEFFTDARAVRGYINNILILLFFYLNFYVLIPKLYIQKKYVLFALVLLACYFVIAFLPEFIVPFQEHGHMPPKPEPMDRHIEGGNRWIFRMGHNIIFFLAVVFFSLLLKINNRLKQTEKEKLKAELSYFKAQINPHFLFNTLNSIYSLAIQKADNTADAVVKLSGMMRYVLSDASHDFVPLEKEIGYITDYIDLQRIRFGETVKINYRAEDVNPGKMIAPLILISFIENAFKFGVNPEEESFIAVNISLSDDDLHLHVYNNKVYDQMENETQGGLGISNAKQRLSLLYPDKHKLEITESDSEFEVDLSIKLI